MPFITSYKAILATILLYPIHTYSLDVIELKSTSREVIDHEAFIQSLRVIELAQERDNQRQAIKKQLNGKKYRTPQGWQTSAECLAKNMYYEARGEGQEGIIAVGNVTLNRIKYWNTDTNTRYNNICEVVYEDSQFSWTGMLGDLKKIPKEELEVFKDYAKIAITSQYYFDNTKGSTNFIRCNLRNSVAWTKRSVYNGTIGSHCFYYLDESLIGG